MPCFTTPGVFVAETDAAPDVVGRPTTVTAFVGHTAAGPADVATPVAGLADFERVFGGRAPDGLLAHAVAQFFANGGSQAVIVRVPQPAAGADDLIGRTGAAPAGLGCLDAASVGFNLLVIPDVTRPDATGTAAALPDVDTARVWQAGLDLCRRRRGFLIIDAPPQVTDLASAQAWHAGLPALAPDAACYAPWVEAADAAGTARRLAPSGFVAGLYARTDATRGVWKAPAGVEADLRGAVGLAVRFDEAAHGALNPLGVNLIRQFPGPGIVCWGARTLAGADTAASTWKYIPVRRTALFIEDSLAHGLAWAAFEPNGEPLWARIRATAASFLDGLFREGAFAGRTAREAWFVRCDGDTTTAADILDGIVHVEVGFAPLKPAEFVVLTLSLALPTA